MENIVITAYGFEFNFDSIPAKSVEALLSRGLNHVLGNEVASKVSTAKKKAETDGTPMTDEAVTELTRTSREAVIAKIMAGELGVRTAAAVTADPVESMMHKLAKEEVSATLKANGIKWTKTDEGRVVTLKSANGPVTYTMEDLVARRLEKHGERIRELAVKEIKAKERKAAKLAETVANDIDL